METRSPYEGHISRPSFSRLLHPTSRLLRYTSRLPKILHQLCLTLLMMLALWGHHMYDLDTATCLELHLPTIQEDCMSIVGLLPQDGE